MGKQNPKRHKAIMLLAQGISKAETARNVRVSETTIYNWLKNPEFEKQLEEETLAHYTSIRKSSIALVGKAENAIIQIMEKDDTPPNIRLKAAIYLDKRGRRSMDDQGLVQRVEKLEEQQEIKDDVMRQIKSKQ